MKHLQRIFLLLLLAAFTFACKKDDDPAPATAVDKLAAKTWKLTGMTASPAISFTGNNNQPILISDLYNQYFAVCIRDNVISFRKDGQRYTVEDVGTACGGDKIQNLGTWIVTSDESSVLLTGGMYLPFLLDEGVSEEWKITELTESSLKVTTQLALSEETTTVITYTFVAL